MKEVLPLSFKNVISSESKSEIIVRSNLCNEEECNKWISDFSKLSKTCWIRFRSESTARMVLHKYWVCHHNTKNKKAKSQMATGCKASIDIKVKKVNYYTKRNDDYLKQSPPLAAVIRLRLDHNHSLDSADSLRHLKLNPEVVTEFEEYFNIGLKPGEAISLHEEKLLAGGLSLADGSVNPSRSAVYYQYNQWKKNRNVVGNKGSQKISMSKLADSEDVNQTHSTITEQKNISSDSAKNPNALVHEVKLEPEVYDTTEDPSAHSSLSENNFSGGFESDSTVKFEIRDFSEAMSIDSDEFTASLCSADEQTDGHSVVDDFKHNPPFEITSTLSVHSSEAECTDTTSQSCIKEEPTYVSDEMEHLNGILNTDGTAQPSLTGCTVKIEEFLPKSSINVVACESQSEITVRSSIYTAEDCNKWIDEYSRLSKTGWISWQSAGKPERMVFHKYWICHHNTKNKKAGSQMSTGCKASIDIKVKKVNYYTKRNDEYLKLSPPLAAVIRLRLDHNHSLNSADFTRHLKLNPEVVTEFEEYFINGLQPGEAVRLYENKLKAGGLPLSDGSINPSPRAVYHMHYKWKNRILASRKYSKEMTESKKANSEQGKQSQSTNTGKQDQSTDNDSSVVSETCEVKLQPEESDMNDDLSTQSSLSENNSSGGFESDSRVKCEAEELTDVRSIDVPEFFASIRCADSSDQQTDRRSLIINITPKPHVETTFTSTVHSFEAESDDTTSQSSFTEEPKHELDALGCEHLTGIFDVDGAAQSLSTGYTFKIEEFLPKSSKNVVVCKSQSEIVVRSNICTAEDCNKWINEYSKLSKTCWILFRSPGHPEKMVLRKSWACRHSNINKTASSRMATGCKASIDIKVKKLTCNTVRKDKYLKLSSPLAAIIKLRLDHNHSLDSADSLRHLKLSPEVVVEFEEYFNNGLRPGEAVHRHEDKLLSGNLSLADGSINPSPRAVYYMYCKWKNRILDSRKPSQKITGSQQAISDEGKQKNLANTRKQNQSIDSAKNSYSVVEESEVMLEPEKSDVYEDSSTQSTLIESNVSGGFESDSTINCDAEDFTDVRTSDAAQFFAALCSADQQTDRYSLIENIMLESPMETNSTSTVHSISAGSADTSLQSSIKEEPTHESDSIEDLNAVTDAEGNKQSDDSTYNPNRCPLCKKNCRDFIQLKQHMRHKHLKEKQHHCTQCEKSFSVKKYLNDHIKRTHGDMKFNCEQCEFRSKYSQSLKLHISSVHLKKRPHKCPQCDSYYEHKSSLTQHISSVH